MAYNSNNAYNREKLERIGQRDWRILKQDEFLRECCSQTENGVPRLQIKKWLEAEGLPPNLAERLTAAARRLVN